MARRDLQGMDEAELAEEYARLNEARPDLTADRRVLVKLVVGRLRGAPTMDTGKAAAWEVTGLGAVGRIVADGPEVLVSTTGEDVRG